MPCPTFGYRLVDGKVEKQIFSETLPEGWVDNPADVSSGSAVQGIPATTNTLTLPKRRGRPPKVRAE